MKLLSTLTAGLHALAERRQTPAEKRASEAINRMNVASDRIIAKGSTNPLRDALDIMAEHR